MTAATLPAPAGPPAAPLLTADEFVRRYAGRYAELVDGVVVESPMPHQDHGSVCNLMGYYLTHWALTGDHGRVTSNDSFVKVESDPDRVRGADVCFFSYSRLPKGPVPKGVLPVSPDLVVEVRSPSDGWNEVFTKVGEYLTAGVRAVVVLDIATRSASVYRTDARQEVFDADRELTVPDVLPGFAVLTGRLFD